MNSVKIEINAVGDPKLFPELEGMTKLERTIHGFGILEKGMESGACSVMFVTKLNDKEFVISQLSAAMFFTLAAALKGACERFGDTKSLEAYINK